MWRSGVWERRIIREELADELGRAVASGEYQEIARDRINDLRRSASSALVNAQHELAFRKRRVRQDGKDPESDRLVNGWREEIQHLRRLST